ncbi:hypothetical protein [Streptomyces sp. MMG1121]|uniref:hypothetical protein n=1 Tax=Streptomyces sp. MMG1121 TaxID=1415544 RepID=UPI0006AE290C|nr:hypothetical protein [Streptomyces sp. MMG1121]KOV59300.1 hypothetical protein ADK64_34900 [Streptomyces sp. MMG1121]
MGLVTLTAVVPEGQIGGGGGGFWHEHPDVGGFVWHAEHPVMGGFVWHTEHPVVGVVVALHDVHACVARGTA